MASFVRVLVVMHKSCKQRLVISVCLAGGSRTWIIMSSPLFVSLCFPKICLSIPHLNDAIGWILIYLHEFLVNFCGSFIGLLFSTYCEGTVGCKRSTWI